MSASKMTFNHTRGDGFYDPCPVCWAQMSEEDKIASVLGSSDDPYEDRCTLESLRNAGHPLNGPLEELRALYHTQS